MEIKMDGVNMAKVLEEQIHKELPHMPVVVVDGGEFEEYVTAFIFGSHYKVSLYQLVHEGVDACAKLIVGIYKEDITKREKYGCVEDGGKTL